MPITRLPTQEELQQIAAAGGDPKQYANKPLTFLTDEEMASQQQSNTEQPGYASTVGRTLKAHAGGILGGGGGALAGAAGASWLLGPEVGLPASIAAGLIGATGGGVAGGYAGQKLQQAVTPEDIYAQQQLEANQAASTNPKTALATDIIASALASGGKPSTDAIRAGKALIGRLGGKAIDEEGARALIGTTLNAGVNPAINTGISYATTGQMPSASDLAAQIAGGAVFSRQAGWAGRLTGNHTRQAPDEPNPEVTNNDPEQLPYQPAPKQLTAGRRFYGGDQGIVDVEATPVTDTLEHGDAVLVNGELHHVIGADEKGNVQTINDSGKTVSQPERATPDLLASPEVIDKIIDKGATKPQSVQRIFPKLNLTDDEAEFLLNKANQKQGLPDYANTQQATMEAVRSKTPGSTTPMAEGESSGLREVAGEGETEDTQLPTNQYQKFLDDPNVLPGIKGLIQSPNRSEAEQQILDQYVKNYKAPLETPKTQVNTQPGVKQPVSSATPETKPVLENVPKDKRRFKAVPPEGEQFDTTPIHPTVLNSIANNPKNPSMIRDLAGRKKLSPWQLDQLNRHINGQNGGIAKGPIDDNNAYKKKLSNLSDVELEKAYIEKRMLGRSLMMTGDLQGASQALSEAQFHREVLEDRRNNQVPENVQIHTTQAVGKASIGSTLRQWIQNKNHKYSPLMQEFLKKSDSASKQVKIKIDHDISDNRPYYSGNKDEIHLTPNALNSAKSFLHEVVHGLTFKKLPSEWSSLRGAELKSAMDEYLKSGKSQPIKDLIQCYYKAAKEFGIDKDLFGDNTEIGNSLAKAGDADTVQNAGMPYGMGNLHEFMAEVMSNPLFQKKLDAIDSGTPKISLWGKIKNAITRLMGFSPREGGLLEKALDATHRIIGEERLNEEGEGFAKGPKEDEIPEGITFKPTRSLYDTISRIPHEMAKYLAGGFKKTQIEAEQLRGKWTNSILSKTSNLTANDQRRLDAVADFENQHGKSGAFMLNNTAQRAAYNAERQAHNDSQRLQQKYNIPVSNGEHKVPITPNPYQHNWTMEPKVAATIKAGTDLKAIQKYHDDFVNNAIHKFGKVPLAAEEAWNKLVDNTTGKSSNNAPNLEHFSGSRYEQEVPLPPSMRRGWLRNAEVYYNRMALNHAYYHNVESDPKMMATLGEEKDAWGKNITPSKYGSLAGNDAVRAQLNEFHGSKEGTLGHTEEAVSSLMTRLFISNPGLEVHKVISNEVGAISTADNPIQAAKALAYGLANLKKGYETSVKNGITHLTAKSAMSMFDRNATFAERLQGLAASIQKVSTLGGLTTKFNDGLMQSSMEYILPFKIEKANKGNLSAMQFLGKLDPDYTRGKTYNQDEVSQLASQATAYIHGSHDGRTMPAWMQRDSEISGFFKLAHWSVSQTNRFMSDVYTPATQGNITPLVMSIFGATIGGYMIKDIREKLQGKKYALPSLTDIANSDRGLSGNSGLLAYNAIAACQYAGFAGILSQLARVPFDKAYKNEPQGAAFPLDEIISDLANTISEVGTAAANDPHFNWLDGAKAVMTHILSSDFQLGRLAINQGINNGYITGMPAEKKMLSDKMQNLRQFNMVEGLPYEENDPGSNPYMNLEQKKFHMEQDIPTAMQQLPGLINRTIQTYHNTPDVMMAKLKALKDSSYPTMPNPETYPMEFYKYVHYLDKENPGQGEAFIQDYMKRKAINEAKGSAVP